MNTCKKLYIVLNLISFLKVSNQTKNDDSVKPRNSVFHTIKHSSKFARSGSFGQDLGDLPLVDILDDPNKLISEEEFRNAKNPAVNDKNLETSRTLCRFDGDCLNGFHCRKEHPIYMLGYKTGVPTDSTKINRPGHNIRMY